MRNLNSRSAGPMMAGDAQTTPLSGAAFFQSVQHTDAVQVIGLWVLTALVFSLRWYEPDTSDLQWILAILAVWLFGTEAALFLRRDVLILRGKTAYMFGFFTYVLLSPALGSIERLGPPAKGATTAVAASLLFLSLVMTAYVGTRVTTANRGFLERFVVDLDDHMLLRILLICFVPTIILRIFLQDWSKVSGVIPGLLGIGSQPWQHTGLGDSKVIFSPIHWLYTLAPAFSGLCWVRSKRTPVLRFVIVLIWLFMFPALMLQRSRGLLVATVVLVLAVMLLVESDPRKRRNLYLLFLGLLPILTILANLLLIDRGTGYVAGQVWEEGRLAEGYEVKTDPRTLLEDNLYYFAGTANVVPDVVPRRSPWELYYFMAINPIPRVLWPAKPIMDQASLGKIRPYYAAITIVGDLYVYGGWWHIVVFALILGYVLKRIDCFGKAAAVPETGRVALYAFLILSMFYSIRALWSLVVSLYAILTLLVILFVVRRQQRVRRAATGTIKGDVIHDA